jgi:hypothetical protein
VSRNLAPANDERLRIGGIFNVVNMAPPIDPIANGFGRSIEAARAGASRIATAIWSPASSV